MTTTKKYKCQNFGVCPLADKEELIHFDDDDRFQCQSKEHIECPSKNLKCREQLVEIQPKSGLKRPLPVLIGAPVVLLLLIIGVSLGSCGGNTHAAKEKEIALELKKIWPWLSP